MTRLMLPVVIDLYVLILLLIFPEEFFWGTSEFRNEVVFKFLIFICFFFFNLYLFLFLFFNHVDKSIQDLNTIKTVIYPFIGIYVCFKFYLLYEFIFDGFTF